MILNAILGMLQVIMTVLLAPLNLIHVAVDFLAGSSFVSSILSVVGYLLPISELSPLIILLCGLFIFRILVSVIKAIVDILPMW